MKELEHQKVVIIGSGPSGWAAAVYLARANLAPLVIAGDRPGGQLMLTTEVENYAGFRDGVQGPVLMQEMQDQAKRFGAVLVQDHVTKIDTSSKPFRVTAMRNTVTADAVLISTGAETIWLNVPGEQEFIGRGVSSCAVCDAAFFKEKDTIIVGGGDSAMEDALALTKFANSVQILHRRDSFRASKIMAERVMSHPKVKVHWNTVVTEIIGESAVSGVRAQEVDTDGNPVEGSEKEIPVQGVFVAIGHKPSTKPFADTLALDDKGYLLTRLGLSAQSVEMATAALKENKVQFPTMTSVEGVFGAGDVVDFRYRQAITAAGFGAMAALDIERWLESK